MFDTIINFIKELGIGGLYIVVIIEGLSIPFPGTPLLLTYGYLLDPDIMGNIKLAFIMSIIYDLASLIPFFIGDKIGDKLLKYKKVKKAQKWFQKYGDISISLARPLGFGNYISFIAGIAKTKLWKYGVLTFIGIYPWFFVILFSGRVFKGNGEKII